MPRPGRRRRPGSAGRWHGVQADLSPQLLPREVHLRGELPVVGAGAPAVDDLLHQGPGAKVGADRHPRRPGTPQVDHAHEHDAGGGPVAEHLRDQPRSGPQPQPPLPPVEPVDTLPLAAAA